MEVSRGFTALRLRDGDHDCCPSPVLLGFGVRGLGFEESAIGVLRLRRVRVHCGCWALWARFIAIGYVSRVQDQRRLRLDVLKVGFTKGPPQGTWGLLSRARGLWVGLEGCHFCLSRFAAQAFQSGLSVRVSALRLSYTLHNHGRSLVRLFAG